MYSSLGFFRKETLLHNWRYKHVKRYRKLEHWRAEQDLDWIVSQRIMIYFTVFAFVALVYFVTIASFAAFVKAKYGLADYLVVKEFAPHPAILIWFFPVVYFAHNIVQYFWISSSFRIRELEKILYRALIVTGVFKKDEIVSIKRETKTGIRVFFKSKDFYTNQRVNTKLEPLSHNFGYALELFEIQPGALRFYFWQVKSSVDTFKPIKAVSGVRDDPYYEHFSRSKKKFP